MPPSKRSPRVLALSLALATATAAACAAPAAGGPATARAGSRSNTYDIGMAREAQARVEIPRMLSRFQFVVERTDVTDSSLRYVTLTRPRRVFDDESAAGIVGAQMSVEVLGRKREAAGGDVFRLQLVVNDQVRVHADSAWLPARETPQLKRYVDGMVMEFRAEFDTGEHMLP